MPLCLLGQLPPGLHWMTDDREAPEKKEFASVLAVKSLEESGAFKNPVSEMRANNSAGGKGSILRKIKVSALVRIK